MAQEHARSLLGGRVAAALALLLSISAGPAGAATPNPDADVCNLVSLDAARQIVGGPVTSAAASSDSGGSSCNYQLSDSGPVVTVSLLNTTLAAVETEEANAKESPAAGLGPGAFWSARYLALHAAAPNGQVMRISVDREEGRWSGANLKTLATSFATTALKPS